MTQDKHKKDPYKLLLVDDSWVLRRVLRGTLSQQDDVQIVGEATNGVEALDLILRFSPDVILLDAEMPLMDGMTTLQHLMIHTPTPTIMLSSLSKPGSPRCFDALKYGAIDFINKNSFLQETDEAAHFKLVIRKVLDASRVIVPHIDLMQQRSDSGGLKGAIEKIVFCEECGAKNSFKSWQLTGDQPIHCKKCGDEIAFARDRRYQRMNYITVLGAGASGYANLLRIIPALTPEMGGAILVMVHDTEKHVASFARYLDSISDFQVVAGKDAMTVEGGCCYVFSGEKQVELSPYSGQYRLNVGTAGAADGSGMIDNLMFSVSSLLKHRVTGVLLSGEGNDGSKGLAAILEEKGSGLVLNPAHCLHKEMSSAPLQELKLQGDLDASAIAAEIKKNHFGNKESVVTA